MGVSRGQKRKQKGLNCDERYWVHFHLSWWRCCHRFFLLVAWQTFHIYYCLFTVHLVRVALNKRSKDKGLTKFGKGFSWCYKHFYMMFIYKSWHDGYIHFYMMFVYKPWHDGYMHTFHTWSNLRLWQRIYIMATTDFPKLVKTLSIFVLLRTASSSCNHY